VRVHDASGSALPTAWVERGWPGVAWRTDGRLLGEATAELLTELPAGRYRFAIRSDGCKPLERSITLPQEPGAPVEQEVRLEPE
jgi:hypothetical protein